MDDRPFTKGEILSTFLMTIMLVFGCVFLVAVMIHDDSLTAESHQNQYLVPFIDCGTNQTVVEYGIKDGSLSLQAYPNTRENTWKITPENESLITKDRFMREDYLIVYCDNPTHSPEIRVTSFPYPQNGMKVLFKR